MTVSSFNRRAFLKILGVGSGTLLLSGCSTGLLKPNEQVATRRIRKSKMGQIAISGQIGRQDASTVLSHVDGQGQDHQRVISPGEKQAFYNHLQRRFREVRQPHLALYVAGVLKLINADLRQPGYLIDREFPGKDREIRGRLLNHLREVDPTFSSERIVFEDLDHQAPAYQTAHSLYREPLDTAQSVGQQVSAFELLTLVKLA